MTETPICDFVRDYIRRDPLRLHMPGHKGNGPLGIEAGDITEIGGADVLYAAEGIIRRSEDIAAALFGAARTVYSAEGSSLCIRAMLYLTMLHAKVAGKPFRVAAGRNAHRTFLSAAALLDAEICWLYPEEGESLLSCHITPEKLERALKEAPCAAVYITSPNYLGQTTDLRELARVCRAHDVLLLVDNAHGAYLRFLPRSRHPLSLGADLCCDSAHKTLPVITGGAYLHFAASAPESLIRQAEHAMALFASTSPSYLILQSLDGVNPRLAREFPEELAACTALLDGVKERLRHQGWTLMGDEPLKLTLAPKSYGYTGQELAARLEEENIVCEFADPDHLVLMLTPEAGADAPLRLEAALSAIPRRSAIPGGPPPIPQLQQRLTPRQALFSPGEMLPVEQCVGRILADANVACPPAVPVAVCGEELNEAAVALMSYYGISHCRVTEDRP